MKREEVKQQYKWRLEDIFETDELFEESFNEALERAQALAAYKGKLGDRDTLLEVLKQSDELDLQLERVYIYANMRLYEDNANDFYQGLAMRSQGLVAKISTLMSWFTPELSGLDEQFLLDTIADPRFSDYDYALGEVVRKKKHILSEKEERLMSLAGDTFSSFKEAFGMFNDIEVPFAPVTVNGVEQKLTHGTYSLFLQNPAVGIRKQAFENVQSAFKQYINTITAIYAGNVKKNVFTARARGYQSCLERAMDVDNVPSGCYENLVKAVGEGTEVLHRYVALRKKLLGGELHMHDMHCSLVKDAELKLEYEEAYELVTKALAPLGKDYVNVLKEAKDSGWIDVFETDNKRSGAFHWGPFDVHPFVMLNYQKTTHDIFTIAHEMGHAMHSFYTKRTQPYSKGHYSIFVAEVASTVNEVLLLKYLISSTDNAELKKYLLSYYLDMFRTTMFRQTMFAEFEATAHKMAEEGKPLTQKALCEIYYGLNQKYYGPSVVHDDLIRYEWARIPHFYNAFYVYKYSTGITSAINIATAILKKGDVAVADYKKFLSAGGNGSPYEILKLANVDLMTKKPYNNAIKEFEAVLSELEALC